MGKKIFLIRHGQTDYNLNGIVQGSGVNAPLNDSGMEQAKLFFESYRDQGFEKVYTSALLRTHQTVSAFVDAGVPWDILPELNEISWGKHEGKKISPEEDAYYHWLMKQWQDGNTQIGIEGGESPDEVAVRLQLGLDRIMKGKEEKVLVCMHGRAMRIMLCVMLNYPIKSMDLFEHSNLCLYTLHHSGTMFTIETHNSVSHLKSDRRTLKFT